MFSITWPLITRQLIQLMIKETEICSNTKGETVIQNQYTILHWKSEVCRDIFDHIQFSSSMLTLESNSYLTREFHYTSLIDKTRANKNISWQNLSGGQFYSRY